MSEKTTEAFLQDLFRSFRTEGESKELRVQRSDLALLDEKISQALKSLKNFRYIYGLYARGTLGNNVDRATQDVDRRLREAMEILKRLKG